MAHIAPYFTQVDQLFFDQIQEEAVENETLKKAAAANSKEDFRYVFEKAFEGLVIDRMDGNEEIFGRLMSDGEFRKLASEYLLNRVYNALQTENGEDADMEKGKRSEGSGRLDVKPLQRALR